MSGLQRKDYLLRQVRAIAEMLARIAGLRIRGASEEARAELEKSYSLLLGSQTDLVRRVDASTAAVLLGSPERILAFAQLLNEEAEQEVDETRRALLKARAVELGAEAARRDPENEAIRGFLSELRREEGEETIGT